MNLRHGRNDRAEKDPGDTRGSNDKSRNPLNSALIILRERTKRALCHLSVLLSRPLSFLSPHVSPLCTLLRFPYSASIFAPCEIFFPQDWRFTRLRKQDRGRERDIAAACVHTPFALPNDLGKNRERERENSCEYTRERLDCALDVRDSGKLLVEILEVIFQAWFYLLLSLSFFFVF